MFGRIIQGQQRFFLNSQEIPGVQTFNASFETSATPLQYFGDRDNRTIPNGFPTATVGINRYVLTQDYFIGLTGSTGFNGCILNDRTKSFSASERNFAFVSGYMTSYRLTLDLNGIPQTNTTFAVFNQFGGLPSITDPQFMSTLQDIEDNTFTEYLKIPAPWTIDVNIDDNFSTNRIQNLDLQINPQYTPLYSFDSIYPRKVEIRFPMEVNLSFKVEIDKFGMESLYNYPGPNKNIKNISLVLRSIDLNETISSYSFNNMEMLSENYIAGVGQNVYLDGTYRCFLGRPN